MQKEGHCAQETAVQKAKRLETRAHQSQGQQLCGSWVVKWQLNESQRQQRGQPKVCSHQWQQKRPEHQQECGDLKARGADRLRPSYRLLDIAHRSKLSALHVPWAQNNAHS